MYRHIICIVAVMLAVACRAADRAPVPVIDLLRELDRAEKRPPQGFELTAHTAGERVRAALLVPVPSRLTIPVRMPERATLRAFVSLPPADPSAAVRFRVGVSDDRIYEGLREIVLTGEDRRWVDLRVDLSAYAGFKWSLFYRPDRMVWRLVLATDALAGAPVGGVWGTPEIVTDEGSAREYVRRVQVRESDPQ